MSNLIQRKLLSPTAAERRAEVFCNVCYGNRIKCLQSSCPLLLRARAATNVEPLLGKTSFFGSSPPAIFVGAWGYPNVSAGPMISVTDDLEPQILDSPADWLNRTFEEILHYRFSLLRGKTPIHVKSAANSPRLIETVQEAAMASTPPDVEMVLKKKPTLRVHLSPRSPPTGPSGEIAEVRLAENPRVEKPVERAISDTDLRANEGILQLYTSEVSDYRITKIFSSGLLGVKGERRFVPTEWSITAVDDILGKFLHKQVLNLPPLDHYEVYGHRALANNVQILLLPSVWAFEVMEAWPFHVRSEPEADFELRDGRNAYPTRILGAYHATRLPTLEHLGRIGRQAGAIAFLEVYKEWIPLGVWRFREIGRCALRGKGMKFQSLDDALNEVFKRLQLPGTKWLKASTIIKLHRGQTKLEKFLA